MVLSEARMRLKDKIAIIVGAGQSPGEGLGNGRATVLRFAQEGATHSAIYTPNEALKTIPTAGPVGSSKHSAPSKNATQPFVVRAEPAASGAATAAGRSPWH